MTHTVLERFEIKKRGHVIVLNARGKVGDTIRCGDRSWVVRGVETFAILNPPLPWGFLLSGGPPPDIGENVVIEAGSVDDTGR